MDTKKFHYLALAAKPNIVGLEAACWLTGLSAEASGINVRARHLPVLGDHMHGNQYFFATDTLLRLGCDMQWLEKKLRKTGDIL